MEDLERTVAQLSAVLSPGGAGGPGAATGLVSGDPGAQVRRVLFATSLTDYVVDEAIAAGVELLVVLMGPSHIDLVGAHGRLLRRLIRADIADRKSTRLNSSHVSISYAVFCLKKKKKQVDNN